MFLFVGYFFSLLFLAIGSIIIARLLGPEGLGLFTLALVIPNLMLSFIDFGIGAALTRFSAKYRAEEKYDLVASYLKSGFLFKFVIGVILSLLCFIFADEFAAFVLKRPDLGLSIRLSSPIILFQASFNYLTDSFSGLDRMDGNATVMNVEAIVKMILSPILLLLGFGVLGAIVGYVISYIVAVIIGGIIFLKFYKRLGKPYANSFLQNTKSMISYGFPLYTSGLLAAILSQVQIMILALFVSSADIGNFNIAAGLIALVSVLVYPFSALFPAFSKIKRGSSELGNLFNLSVKYTSIMIVPVTLMIAILSRNIVFTLYGRIYILAPSFLSLYILTNLYAGLGSVVVGHLLNGIGETRYSLHSSVINFVIFLPLAYILTQSFNIFGFLIAVIIANTCSFLYSLWAAIKKVGVKLNFRSSSRIYLASILSAIPILILTYTFQFYYGNIVQFYFRILTLLFDAGVFVFIYLTLLPIVSAVDESDVENIKLLFRDFKILQPLINPVLKYESKLLSILKRK
jgi:O-antigen/teichoic acid export membrane protein